MEMPGAGKTWLEAALNGPWTRARQPRIPVTVDEVVADAVACVDAGAAIVHVHAYDAATGALTQDPDVYSAIVEGVRGRVDAIVYPAVPATAPAQAPQERFAHVEELARRGLVEWIAVEPGSANFCQYDDLIRDQPGSVRLNTEEDVRHGLKIAMRHRLHPSYAIREPGYVRLGATLHWRESCPAPVYRFTFTSGCTFSFPPEDYALTAYLKLLDQVAPGAPWMAAGFQADILPMIPRVLAEGGHVRVGLEDAAFGCGLSNPQLVERAQRTISDAGGELAAAREVRIAIDPEEHGLV